MNPAEKSTAGAISTHWQWPLDLTRYEQTPLLSSSEYAELKRLVTRYDWGGCVRWFEAPLPVLDRLFLPIQEALTITRAKQEIVRRVLRLFVIEMAARHSTLWAWTHDEWVETLGTSSHQFSTRHHTTEDCRQHVAAVAYLLNRFNDCFALGQCQVAALARKVFGQHLVQEALQRVQQELLQWGYGTDQTKVDVARALSAALLLNGSPCLEDLSTETLSELRQRQVTPQLPSSVFRISRVLAHLGILDQPLSVIIGTTPNFRNADACDDVPELWVQWCQRWRATSTLSRKSRTTIYYDLLKIGRWLAYDQMEVKTPEQWTRDVAVACVAAVDRMVVGEFAHTNKVAADKMGKPIMANSKSRILGALRTFFQDCQEWGWVSRHFDPRRCLATPRSVRALIAPNPRVIADDIWAKLLWAGLNLTQEDLPMCSHYPGATTAKSTSWYPLEMVRAMVVVWLFAGLRSDELQRLRVGCIRWQREDVPTSAESGTLSKDAICWLDVPINKTSTAFTKPVDRVVGEAIAAWEHLRPDQPVEADPKTGEVVHYLFAYRGRRIAKSYINRHLIPLLCRKAGVPTKDARGDITSHRARSTIATQLYNAREPLSLFELQEWLGHRNVASTQHYAKLSPTRLAKAYTKAGYFGRNMRMVEVLIDQNVVKSAAATAGVPWKFYDLGHGYCSYEFFEQCPHRMACAKCAFYRPKGSSQAQLLEGKANLLRMLQEIPLSEEERAAVEDGITAMEKLSQNLANVPTPAGPTPSQLSTENPGMSSMIPIEQIRRKRQGL